LLISVAAVGGSLFVLKVRWGSWLLLPAITWFLVWPALRIVVPLLPTWAVVGLVLFAPALVLILFLRAALDVLTGLYGRDVSARVVSHALISTLRSFLGASGRERRHPAPEPILPRPTGSPSLFDELTARRAQWAAPLNDREDST
jgi:hypothetical protein